MITKADVYTQIMGYGYEMYIDKGYRMLGVIPIGEGF